MQIINLYDSCMNDKDLLTNQNNSPQAFAQINLTGTLSPRPSSQVILDCFKLTIKLTITDILSKVLIMRHAM